MPTVSSMPSIPAMPEMPKVASATSFLSKPEPARVAPARAGERASTVGARAAEDHQRDERIDQHADDGGEDVRLCDDGAEQEQHVGENPTAKEDDGEQRGAHAAKSLRRSGLELAEFVQMVRELVAWQQSNGRQLGDNRYGLAVLTYALRTELFVAESYTAEVIESELIWGTERDFRVDSKAPQLVEVLVERKSRDLTVILEADGHGVEAGLEGEGQDREREHNYPGRSGSRAKFGASRGRNSRGAGRGSGAREAGRRRVRGTRGASR
mgnify:CR=1 FL=1